MVCDDQWITDKTDRIVNRAVDWSQTDPDVAGLVLCGSAAQGRTHSTSDVDLVIVTRPGRRDHIWNVRAKIASQLLQADIAWSHDLPGRAATGSRPGDLTFPGSTSPSTTATSNRTRPSERASRP